MDYQELKDKAIGIIEIVEYWNSLAGEKSGKHQLPKNNNGKTPLSEKRHQMKKGHQELIDQKYLKSYTIDENDIIIVNLTDEWLEKIWKKKKRAKQIEHIPEQNNEPFFEDKPTPKGKSIPSRKPFKNECPHGAVFGIDCNKIDECQECEQEIFEACKDKQDEVQPEPEPKVIIEPDEKPVMRPHPNTKIIELEDEIDDIF